MFASADSNAISFWNIFSEDGKPLTKWTYDKEGSPGLSKASINSDKTKIAFIEGEEIVIIK